MRAGVVLILFGMACSGAQGAPFADPTRPPGALPGELEPAAGAPEAPRLQSILIAPNRRVAVIGGQTIPLGGMYGEAKVVRITEGEVVLQTGQERQILKLLSEVEKRAVRSRATRAAQKGARK